LAEHYSLLSNFFLLLAAMASKFILAVQCIFRQMFQREDIAKDMVFAAYSAGSAYLKAAITLGAAEIAKCAFEFESTRFASRWVFMLFGEDPEVVILMRGAGVAGGRECLHEVLMLLLLLLVFFLLLGFQLVLGLLLRVYLHGN
jgi:hypothetical protein